MPTDTIRKPKPDKRARLSRLTRKALQLWSKTVKQRDGHVCQLCGAREGDLNANGKPVFLNAHHLVSRRCKALRLDLRNGITLCQNCHKFSTLGPHRGALFFGEWLIRSRPGLAEYLVAHAEDAAIETEEGLQLAIDQFKEALHGMP